MAERISKINYLTNEGSPVRIEDLNDLWESLNLFALSKSSDTNPIIISGFAVTGNAIGRGLFAHAGQLYLFPGGMVNQYLWKTSRDNTQRSGSSGTPFLFYKDFTGHTSDNPTGAIGTQIGQLTVANINTWKGVFQLTIPNNFITTPMIGNSQVTGIKIADGSISNLKIIPEAVGQRELAQNAVINTKIATGAVEVDKITPVSIGGYYFSSFSITASTVGGNTAVISSDFDGISSGVIITSATLNVGDGDAVIVLDVNTSYLGRVVTYANYASISAITSTYDAAIVANVFYDRAANKIYIPFTPSTPFTSDIRVILSCTIFFR